MGEGIPELFVEQWSHALVQASVEGLLLALLTLAACWLVPKKFVAFRYYISLLALVAFPVLFALHLFPLDLGQMHMPVLTQQTLDSDPIGVMQHVQTSNFLIDTKKHLMLITEQYSAALFYSYLAGFFMLTFHLFRQGLQIRHIRKETESITDTQLDEIFALALTKFSLAKQVVLRSSRKMLIPFTVGHFRPMIVLPLAIITQLPYEQIESILLHELAHIKRHDYIVNFFQRIIETLFFFHPMVWLLSGYIREQRELLCDDLVLLKTSKRADYAKALLATSQLTQMNLYSLGINGKSRNNTKITYRIKRMIMKPKHHSKRLQWFVPIVMLALVFTTAAFTSKTLNPSKFVSGGVEPATVPSVVSIEKGLAAIKQDAHLHEQTIDDTLVIDKERNKFIDLDNQLITTTKSYDGEKKAYKLQFRNGKVVKMWLNDKEIPKKEFAKHQAVIDDTKEDIAEAEESLKESMEALEDLDLDVIMKGVDASLEAVASIDWEGMMGLIEMTLEDLDTAEVQMELDKAFHALDSIDINKEISRALSEIDREEIRREVTEGMREARIEMHREMMREGMREWNTDEIREKMREIREEMHKTDPEEIRREMHKVQEQIRKMHLEMRNEELVLREKMYNNLDTEKKLEKMEEQLEALEKMQKK